MENFIDRLNSLINEISNGNVSDFAKKSSIKQATLFNYTKGRMPNAESLYNICNNLGVSIDWLLAGKGEPYLSFEAKEKSGNKEAEISRKCSPNHSEISDAEIIEQFSDKRSARDLVLHLAELERINSEAFNKVGPYIKGLLDGLRIKPTECCMYTGPDRRIAERRVKDKPEKFKGAKDRRSGKDRRVAVQG